MIAIREVVDVVDVVIMGCGYTGERLARRLVAASSSVSALVHREDRGLALRRIPGVSVRIGDVSAPITLAGLIPAGALVVDSVPPAPGQPPHTRSLALAAARSGAQRIVYLSSTGVYGQGHGEWVDEDTAPVADTPQARARIEAEEALFAAAASSGLEAVALRIAAIYGPGRGVHVRLRAKTYAIVGEGDNWVSRIHVDDLVSAILAAGSITPLPRNVYLVADDEPETARVHADGVAALLGLPPPGSVGVNPASSHLTTSNRRVRNARLKQELGVVLRYPSWRKGVLASLAEEERQLTPPRIS